MRVWTVFFIKFSFKAEQIIRDKEKEKTSCHSEEFTLVGID